MRARRGGGVVPALFVALVVVDGAAAYVLDAGRRFDVRLRAYSQAAIATEGSSGATTPERELGDVIQHRNFYNPEFDARLTDFTTWMRGLPGLGLLAPEDLRFRFAWWGFYDGIYDYGAPQYARAVRTLRARFSESDDPYAESFFLRDDRKRPRDVYAHRNRVNELYLDWARGPVWLRIGRQAISWGESDAVTLLDASNPFDITLGGLFQDVDEARVPLWTVRATADLFDVLGPFSSGFVDAYLVPGNIDVTTAITPISTVSPYAAPGGDPQTGDTPFVSVDWLPERRFGNSRWGVRFQTVIARHYTTSIWYYRTFPNGPVSLLLTPPPSRHPLPVVVASVHDLVGVAGIATTFYEALTNGVVRAELEAFVDEPSFIPERNFDPRALIPPAALGRRQPVRNSVPRADYLRWTLGWDRFFFIRALNPANSFAFGSAFNGQVNLDETGTKDFRSSLPKPGAQPLVGSGLAVRINPRAFADIHRFDNLSGQISLQTDYLHGRLTPRLVFIANVRGVFAVVPELIYRLSDSFILSTKYIAIDGAFTQLGFLRDRDQVQFRVTYQLN